MKVTIIILGILLSACSAKPYAIKSDIDNQPASNKIFIVSHGWHTGIVVPSNLISRHLVALGYRFSTPYIEIGWGDKGFYKAETITSDLTLRAIFLPTESVIHAVAVPEDVAGYFLHSQVHEVCLNSSAMNSLIEYISSSFYKAEEGGILTLGRGIYGNSQFYKGVGNYYLMNTCNKWTAKGLASAGRDISPIFKLTASSIMQSLKTDTNCVAKSYRMNPRPPSISENKTVGWHK